MNCSCLSKVNTPFDVENCRIQFYLTIIDPVFSSLYVKENSFSYHMTFLLRHDFFISRFLDREVEFNKSFTVPPVWYSLCKVKILSCIFGIMGHFQFTGDPSVRRLDYLAGILTKSPLLKEMLQEMYIWGESCIMGKGYRIYMGKTTDITSR